MRARALPTRHLKAKALAGFLALSVLAAACGGATEEEAGETGGTGGKTEELGLTADAGESGLDDAGEPQRGGSVTYALEADTNGGFCLSEGQLAISGMMIVRTIYDTLTVPNAAGEYVPYLAQSVEPNDDYTVWTITPREGITFHDGSPLTAEVIKNNIDAYRGTYEGRSSLLFAFVLQNIEETAVEGDAVTVTMSTPWVSFPSFLFSSSRFGIMAQAQLDDAEGCATNPIGTGPFKFTSWDPNESFKAERNEDYWQIAPDGEPYPYLDSIEFRPITDGQVRNNAIEAGDVDIMHTSNGEDIGGKLKDLRDDGTLNMYVSEAQGEVAFVQFNTTQPPFDDVRMRQALAMGADRSVINDTINGGLPTIANGPFAPDSVAYLEDTGFPEFDAEKAKALVAEYVAEGGKAEFTLTATTDSTVKRLAELIQQRAADAGVNVKIVLRDQAALINDAIGKNFQAMTFRNYPGGDPDANYVWWYGGERDASGALTAPNPVNFAGIDDQEVDDLLDAGRAEPDAAKRKTIYQDLNKIMGSQVYGLWSWFTPWAVVERANVHDILGPQLPGETLSDSGEVTEDPDLAPNLGLATGHSLIGLWVEQ